MANKLTLSAVGLLSLLAVGTFAQTATTIPVGFMRYSIAGGTPAAPVSTAISIPLRDLGGVSGASAGVISGVASSTISVTNAGWTAGALAEVSVPYAVCFMSGSAAGLTVKITANTSSSATLDSGDLAARGVATGDRFEIVAVQTLSTFFGSDTLHGAGTAAEADVVYLLSPGGSWVGYYYNTNRGFWKKTSDPIPLNSTRNDTSLPIGGGVLIERRSSGTIELVVTGVVPSTRFRVPVSGIGNTLIDTGFPTDVTLGALAMQNLIPGWRSDTTAGNSDYLMVKNGTGSWSTYYFNGANWRLTTVPTPKDSTLIPAGSPIMLFRKGAVAGFNELVRALPYSL